MIANAFADSSEADQITDKPARASTKHIIWQSVQNRFAFEFSIMLSGVCKSKSELTFQRGVTCH